MKEKHQPEIIVLRVGKWKEHRLRFMVALNQYLVKTILADGGFGKNNFVNYAVWLRDKTPHFEWLNRAMICTLEKSFLLRWGVCELAGYREESSEIDIKASWNRQRRTYKGDQWAIDKLPNGEFCII